MPFITVSAPTGESIRFYIPKGTTKDEAIALAPTAWEMKQQGVDVEKETPLRTTMGGYAKEFGKGILGGAAGMLETAATGASYLLPEELEKSARTGIASLGAAAQRSVAPGRAYIDSIPRKAGEATGSTVPFLLTSFAGGLPAIAAGTAMGAAAGAGEAGQRAEAAGATSEQIGSAARLGILPGALEMLAPMGIASGVKLARAAGVLENAIGKEAATGITNRVARVSIAGGEEGAQEVITQIAQNLIAQGIYDPETGTFTGTGESFGYGAGVGGLLAALAELAIRGKPRGGRGALTPEEEELLRLPPPQLALPPPAPPPAPPAPQLALPSPALQHQRELVDETGAPIPAKGLETVTADALVAMGVKPRAGIIVGTKDSPSIVGKSITDPTQRAEIVTGLLSYLPLIPGEQYSGARNNIFSLIKQIEDMDSTTSQTEVEKLTESLNGIEPGTLEVPRPTDRRDPQQLGIDAQITESKLGEQAGVRQARVDKQKDTGFQAIDERRDTADAVKLVATPPAAPTAIGSALRTAQADKAAADAQAKQVADAQAVVDAKAAADAKAIRDAKKAAKAKAAADAQAVVDAKAAADAQAAADAARLPVRPITVAMLDTLGIPKLASIRTQFKGKDLNAASIQAALKSLTTNALMRPETKTNIRNLLKELQPKTTPTTTAKKPKPAPVVAPAAVAPAPVVASTPITTTTTPVITNVAETTKGEQTEKEKPKLQQKTSPTSDKPSAPKKLKPKPDPENVVEEDPVVEEEGNTVGDTASLAESDKITEQSRIDAALAQRARDQQKNNQVPTGKELADIDAQVDTDVAKGKDKRGSLQSKNEKTRDELRSENSRKLNLARKELEDIKEKNRRLEFAQQRAENESEMYDGPLPDKDAELAASDRVEEQLAEIAEAPAEEAEIETVEDIDGDVETSLRFDSMGNPIIAEAEGTGSSDTFITQQMINTSDRQLRLQSTQTTVQQQASDTRADAERIAPEYIKTSTLLKEPTGNLAKDAARNIKARKAAAKYFTGKGIAGLQAGIIKLAEDMSTKGLKTDSEVTYAYAWAKSNLSNSSLNTLGNAVRSFDGVNTNPLLARAMLTSSAPLLPDVLESLKAGNLKQALKQLASNSGNPTITKVVNALSMGIGTTKVSVEPGLKNESGEVVAGLFDPKTNTIRLNSDLTLSNHVLIHEVVHAVTSHELANKSSPNTKQLRNLFESLKGRLDTAYGATNLDEFVAEAFSNPKFQSKLAQFYASGEKIPLLVRFWNTVTNIVRKLLGIPAKPLGSAKDLVDSVVAKLISPAPEYRDATNMFLEVADGKEKGVINKLGQWVKGDVSPEDITVLNSWMVTATSKSRRLALEFLPLNAISDIIKDSLPGLHAAAERLNKVIQEKSGMRSKYLLKVRDTAQVLDAVFKGRDAAKKIFNGVVAQSTLVRVDPSKKRTAYENNPEKLKEFDKLQKEFWSKMLDSDREAYKTLRDAYAQIFQELRDTMENRINEMEDEGTRELFRNKVLKELLDKESIEPYFPLYRKGDYWLVYNAIDPYTGLPETYKEAYESRAERDRAQTLVKNDVEIKEGLAKAGIIGTGQIIEAEDRIDENNRRKRPDVTSQFAYALLGSVRSEAAKNVEKVKASTLAKAKADGKTDAQATVEVEAVVRRMDIAQKALEQTVLEALLDAMPERSLARAFSQREGTLGFEDDAIQVFRDRMPNFVSQVTNITYDNEFSRATKEINEASLTDGKGGKQIYAADVANNLLEYVKFARDPQLATWSRALKSASFGMTLGFNLSSVLVNVSNLPIVVLPYLGGKHGYRNAYKAMQNARKLYFQTGTRRSLVGFTGAVSGKTLGGPSLTNIDFTDSKNVPEDFKKYEQLAYLLEARGQANRSTVADALDFDDPSNSTWSKVNALQGALFHQGERFNRQVTAMASYDLYLEKASENGKKLEKADYVAAAEYALETTELTNSGAQLETAPRISQNNLGSLMMMYKRFGISMYYLQFKMAKEALKNADPEVRKQAKKQIIGLFVSSGLMAGIQGMPLVGAVILLANMFLLDDEDDDAESIAARYFGEGLWSGAINASTGLDIAPRIGMTNLVYRSLPNQEQDSLILSAMETLGGPAFGVASRMEDGAKLIADGEIWRGTEKMLPAAISNGFKSIRYGIEGATTLRGDPIMEDINPWNIIGQLFGFAPAGYTQQLELNAKDKRVDRNIVEHGTDLRRQYYMAMRNGDSDEMFKVIGEMAEYSARHPEVAITAKQIRNSIAQHRVTDEMTRQTGGVTFSSRRIAKILADRAEYDDD